MQKAKFLHVSTAFIILFSSTIFAKNAAAFPKKNNLCGPTTTNNPISYWAFRRMAEQIVEQMTLDQKIGQMTLADFTLLPARPDRYQTPGQINTNLITRFNVGGVLVAGDGTPLNCNNNQCDLVANSLIPHIYQNATLSNWQQLARGVNSQPTVIGTNLKDAIFIFPLLGTDAVHGNQHVLGSVLFPHNIGLAATHSPQIFYQAGFWTAQSVRQSGFNWTFAPTVAVSHNPNWGRFYESMGSSSLEIEQYSYCFNQGVQQPRRGFIHGVLASTKHYIGDGATVNGIDEGNVEVSDFRRFFNVNSPGYDQAIVAGTGSVMISYSGVNNVPMTTNPPLLQSLITGRYNGIKYHKFFRGFVVSDYGAIDKAARQGLPTTTEKTTYTQALATSVNGGMDMIMLSPWPQDASISNFQEVLKQLVLNSLYGTFPAIPIQRIDEAVTRILTVKYAMGLIQDGSGNRWRTLDRVAHLFRNEDKNNNQAASDALNAAEKSLVLLKNQDSILPLDINQLKYIVFVGENAYKVRQEDGSTKTEVFQNFNNIGAQNGGWSIRWQGFNGNEYWQGHNKTLSHATSILDGVISLNAEVSSKVQLIYSPVKGGRRSRQAFLEKLKTQYSDMSATNTVIIATLAEPPYAEFMGDINVPYCQNNSTDPSNGCLYNYHTNAYLPDQQKSTSAVKLDIFSQGIINILHQKNSSIPVITVVLSGRPVIITEHSNNEEGFIPLVNSNAFVAAWLPGTTGGQAIANALFGKYYFCEGSCVSGSPNTLPVDWVATMQQLIDYPIYNKGVGIPRYEDPLFNEGYGLATVPKS